MSNKIKIEWGGLTKKSKDKLDFNFNEKIIDKLPIKGTQGIFALTEQQLQQARLQSGEIDLLTYLDNISRDDI